MTKETTRKYIGMGLGSGAGLGTGAVLGNLSTKRYKGESEEDFKKRKKLRANVSALAGGAIGGGLGGGAGVVSDYLPGVLNSGTLVGGLGGIAAGSHIGLSGTKRRLRETESEFQNRKKRNAILAGVAGGVGGALTGLVGRGVLEAHKFAKEASIEQIGRKTPGRVLAGSALGSVAGALAGRASTKRYASESEEDFKNRRKLRTLVGGTSGIGIGALGGAGKSIYDLYRTAKKHNLSSKELKQYAEMLKEQF